MKSPKTKEKEDKKKRKEREMKEKEKEEKIRASTAAGAPIGGGQALIIGPDGKPTNLPVERFLLSLQLALSNSSISIGIKRETPLSELYSRRKRRRMTGGRRRKMRRKR